MIFIGAEENIWT